MSNLEELILAYRRRFHDDPPFFGLDKQDLARRIRDALSTGRPIDLGVPDDAFISPTQSTHRWQEGQVDQNQPHLKIYYVPTLEEPDIAFLVTVIAPPINRTFFVEFLPQNLPETIEPGPIIDQAKRELTSLLVDKREEDPWKYARYHATTASNSYSHIQWAR